MLTDRHILGIDTSNYKTSVAITDRNGNIICDFRELLHVKNGDKGLRQSDAFFQHIKILPELIEKAMSSDEFKKIAAVSVSVKPRPLLNSYMPVFKAGESIGKCIAAALGVNLYDFSHQEGHIEAVKYYSRLKNETKFLCFHLSGGTCELLKIENGEIEIIGGSKDISFGQLLDRIGVGLGLNFPAGEELDQIAISSLKSNIIKKIELQGLYFNLSGVETKSLRNLETEGLVSEVFERISDLLCRLSIKAMEETSIENIIFTGGVSESLFIRDRIMKTVRGTVEFGAPNLSSDNAIGISLLGGKPFMAIKPIKVSQLNGYIKRVLQSDPLLGNVSVIGEISNLKNQGSGHIYFTLKDELSKINCFLGADMLKDIRFELAEGMEITATGFIYIYERGGTYSLNIRDIQVEGTGNLSVAFEKLKEKLVKEGLFNEKQKKPIPLFPYNIAVITSETGAAVKDIIKIIKNRNNIVNVMIFPVLVQGPNAAGEISEAIHKVNQLYPQMDTIIIGRGGGSMEELWAFNEEIVARSIFASRIPIISAVGHEIDFTISDFVADKRAETPTAAAQMAVPDIKDLKEYIISMKDSIDHMLSNKMRYYEMSMTQHNVESLRAGLTARIDNAIYKSDNLKNEMKNKALLILNEYKNQTEMSKQMLESLNPRDILKRGYVAITDKDGLIRSSIKYFNKGDSLTASFMDGSIDCLVEKVRSENIGER